MPCSVLYLPSGAFVPLGSVRQTLDDSGTPLIASGLAYSPFGLPQSGALPALLALVGQTRITQPETLLPQVIATFKTVTDREQQYRLFTAFVALINDEEVLTMVEKLLDDEELLIDTPFMRRLQREREQTTREKILKILETRFSPSTEQMQQTTEALGQITGETRLDMLFLTALQAESLATFQTVLHEQRQQQAGE